MKIRKGFVSNSSSSSFVCDVCGQDVSGYDMSLREAEMYQCENGHTFCEDHALDFSLNKDFVILLIEKSIKETKNSIEQYGEKDYYTEYLKKYTSQLEEVKSMSDDDDFGEIVDNFDYRYELPSKYCPICQMEHILDRDIVNYMLKANSKTKEEIENEMKSKFADLDEFKHYLDN